ncbi:MAG: hypothetical protein PUA56_05975 [Bacillales bacterium]|nr:hypothetical protein [Bacillales bacterium]
MVSIFKSLKKNKKTIYSKTDEYKFYVENSHLIAKILPSFHLGYVEGNDFKLIQANILIKSIQNKMIIENNLEKYRQESLILPLMERDLFIRNKVWKDLDEVNAPYFILDGARIYIPIYSKGLNLIYNDECSKLFEYPYCDLKEKPISACIDSFDVYNFYLFASNFTNLILIKKDISSAAFYHPAFETIYIINDQGRLDISIHLFDRYIKNPNVNNILKRVKDVVEKFYSNDRKEFIKALYANEFISGKTFYELNHKSRLRQIKKDKLVNEGKKPYEIL